MMGNVQHLDAHVRRVIVAARAANIEAKRGARRSNEVLSEAQQKLRDALAAYDRVHGVGA
jgi:hypothetical protein